MPDPDRTSPEATLAAFRDAMRARDWPGALSLLSPRAQKGLVGSAYAGAAWMEGLDDAARRSLAMLMERHGLRDPDAERTRSTEELSAMLADLDAWSRASLPADRPLDLTASVADTSWTEFRRSGDRAYAIATSRGRRSETRLRVQEGAWVILASGE